MKTIDATRARQLAWIAIGVYLVGLGISATFRAQGDFNVYYRAGHRVLLGHAIYPADDSSSRGLRSAYISWGSVSRRHFAHKATSTFTIAPDIACFSAMRSIQLTTPARVDCDRRISRGARYLGDISRTRRLQRLLSRRTSRASRPCDLSS